MCHFTHTIYSCGHEDGWPVDSSSCQRAAAKLAAGHQGPFPPCPVHGIREHSTYKRHARRCEACHDLFKKDMLKERQSRRDFCSRTRQAAGNDRWKEMMVSWYQDIYDEFCLAIFRLCGKDSGETYTDIWRLLAKLDRISNLVTINFNEQEASDRFSSPGQDFKGASRETRTEWS